MTRLIFLYFSLSFAMVSSSSDDGDGRANRHSHASHGGVTKKKHRLSRSTRASRLAMQDTLPRSTASAKSNSKSTVKTAEVKTVQCIDKPTARTAEKATDGASGSGGVAAPSAALGAVENSAFVAAVCGNAGHTLDDVLRMPGAGLSCMIHEDDVWEAGSFRPVQGDLARLTAFMGQGRNQSRYLPAGFDPAVNGADLFHLTARQLGYDYSHVLWLMHEYNRRMRGELLLRGRLLNLTNQLTRGVPPTSLLGDFTLPRRMRHLDLPEDTNPSTEEASLRWDAVVNELTTRADDLLAELDFASDPPAPSTAVQVSVGSVLQTRNHERPGALRGPQLRYPDETSRGLGRTYFPTRDDIVEERLRWNVPLRDAVPQFSPKLSNPASADGAGSDARASLVKAEPGVPDVGADLVLDSFELPSDNGSDIECVFECFYDSPTRHDAEERRDEGETSGDDCFPCSRAGRPLITPSRLSYRLPRKLTKPVVPKDNWETTSESTQVSQLDDGDSGKDGCGEHNLSGFSMGSQAEEDKFRRASTSSGPPSDIDRESNPDAETIVDFCDDAFDVADKFDELYLPSVSDFEQLHLTSHRSRAVTRQSARNRSVSLARTRGFANSSTRPGDNSTSTRPGNSAVRGEGVLQASSSGANFSGSCPQDLVEDSPFTEVGAMSVSSVHDDMNISLSPIPAPPRAPIVSGLSFHSQDDVIQHVTHRMESRESWPGLLSLERGSSRELRVRVARGLMTEWGQRLMAIQTCGITGTAAVALAIEAQQLESYMNFLRLNIESFLAAPAIISSDSDNPPV